MWSVTLVPPVARTRQLQSLLAPHERQRASRFQVAAGRRRFFAARIALRILIGHYLGLDPGEVRFEHTAHGKPHVAAGPGSMDLEFSHSRSHDLALYAFARGRDVGIDVERVLPLPDMEEVARARFSPDEVAALLALPEAARLVAFYRGWTRKEAYLKATGMGLAGDLSRFTVSLSPGEPARLLRVEGNAAEARRWSLQSLEPAAGYAGAVAVEGQAWRLVSRHWSWDNEP